MPYKDYSPPPYSTLSRNSAFAGMLSPADERLPHSMTLRKPSTESRPRPTSTKVPTTARTMLRKNLLALISKYQLVGEV